MKDEKIGQFTKDIRILARPQDIKQRRMIELQDEIDKSEAGLDSVISKIQGDLIDRVNSGDGKSTIDINHIYDRNFNYKSLPTPVQMGIKKLIMRWVRMYGYFSLDNRIIPIGKGFSGKIGTAGRCLFVLMEDPFPYGIPILFVTVSAIVIALAGITALISLLL